MAGVNTEEIDYLVYVDRPDWSWEAGDWRAYISQELRDLWPTFTYEQKWAIAQNAGNIASMIRQV